MSGDKVVFLEFKSKAAAEDGMSFMSCKHCRNKAFVVMYDTEQFPMMKCCACGAHLGRIGWAE